MIKRVLRAPLKQRESSTLDYADKYLTAGEMDERAARLLFQFGELALSVYHIQQAAEKAMKGFCLSVGDVTIEQLRGTHRTAQPLLKIIEQRPASEMTSILSGTGNKDYRLAIRQVKKLVNSDQQKLSKLPMRSNVREVGIETLVKVADALAANEPVLEQKEDEVKRVLATCLPEYKQSIVTYSLVKYGQAAGQCYIFGTLTFPHENYTRYPGGYLDPQDYTQELGIVQAIPAIIERIPRMLNLVREVISIVRAQASEAKADELE